MRRPTALQWRELCSELADTARRLQEEGPELMRRAQIAVRDGYPTSSLGGGGGPSSILDDDGTPMPPLNDPVGELAIARVRRGEGDPVRQAVTDMVSLAQLALVALRRADGARSRALPPLEAPEEPKVAGCVVHLRYGLFAPQRARERCRWCNDWTKAHELLGIAGVDPPESAVRAVEDARIAREQRKAA